VSMLDEDLSIVKESTESLRTSVSGIPRRYVFNTLEFIKYLIERKTEINNGKRIKKIIPKENIAEI
jgi:hypothetical protein